MLFWITQRVNYTKMSKKKRKNKEKSSTQTTKIKKKERKLKTRPHYEQSLGTPTFDNVNFH